MFKTNDENNGEKVKSVSNSIFTKKKTTVLSLIIAETG